MTYDLVSGEVVITATEFKAKCLDLLDRVNSGEIRRVRVTKRGKEVAVLAGSAVHEGRGDFIGWQAGSVNLPDDLDIDGPIYDPEVDGVCDPMSGLR
ncbi:MAG: type II toxin-antitoxin system Phd/YefM family antitoxin [Brevundimonas sp.]